MNQVESRNIPGWPGYQATNAGKIISLPNSWHKESIILKPYKDKKGYLSISLSKDGKRKSIPIHKIIALVFLGPCLKAYHINHKDFNKENNHLDNLEYVTARQNTTHYYLSQKTSSIYIGVSWYNKMQKWQARITINKKTHYLGYFDKEIDAHNKYQAFLCAYNNGKSIEPFLLKRK